MLSPLARGYGSWTGGVDLYGSDKKDKLLLPTIEQEAHRHGVTVTPRTRSAPAYYLPQGQEVGANGQLNLPKTFITRKGALLLFTAPDADSAKSGSRGQRLFRVKKGADTIDLSLKLRTMERLGMSVLQYGDEEYEREDTSITDPGNKTFLKFMHHLDDRDLDMRSQPGGDVGFYLRDLRSRASSRLQGSGDTSLPKSREAQELRAILQGLEGNWPLSYPQDDKQEQFTQHFPRSGSPVHDPQSGSPRPYQVLSWRKLAACLKSVHYLRQTASKGQTDDDTQQEDDDHKLPRSSLRSRSANKKWSQFDSTPEWGNTPDSSSVGSSPRLEKPTRSRGDLLYQDQSTSPGLAAGMGWEEVLEEVQENGEVEGTGGEVSEVVVVVKGTSGEQEISSAEVKGRDSADVSVILGDGISQIGTEPAQGSVSSGESDRKVSLTGAGDSEENTSVNKEISSVSIDEVLPVIKDKNDSIVPDVCKNGPKSSSGVGEDEKPDHLIGEQGSDVKSLEGEGDGISQSVHAAPDTVVPPAAEIPAVSSRTLTPVVEIPSAVGDNSGWDEAAQEQAEVGSVASSLLEEEDIILPQEDDTKPVEAGSLGVAQPLKPQYAGVLRESEAASGVSSPGAKDQVEERDNSKLSPDVGSRRAGALSKSPRPPSGRKSGASQHGSRPNSRISPGRGTPRGKRPGSAKKETEDELTGEEGQTTLGEEQLSDTASRVSGLPPPEPETLVSRLPDSRSTSDMGQDDRIAQIDPALTVGGSTAEVKDKNAVQTDKSVLPSDNASLLSDVTAELKKTGLSSAPGQRKSSQRKGSIPRGRGQPGGKQYTKALEITSVQPDGEEEGDKEASEVPGPDDQSKQVTKPPIRLAKKVKVPEKPSKIPDHLQDALARRPSRSRLELDKKMHAMSAIADSALSGPLLEDEFGDEGLTEEELAMAQKALMDKLATAREQLDGAENPQPTKKPAKQIVKSAGKGGKKGKKKQPEDEVLSDQDRIKEQKRLEKLKRLEEAQALDVEIQKKEAIRREADEEALAQQQEAEEEMERLKQEAEDIMNAEEDAREQMAEVRKKQREEREIRRKEDMERKKQMAIDRREKERKMMEEARKKEQDMLERIADGEMRRRLKEEEERKRDEEERLAQERLEEELVMAQREAEEEEEKLRELERQAEEEAMQRLIDERENAERLRRQVNEEKQRLAEEQEKKRQEMLEEERRLGEEKRKKDEEDERKRAEEKKRLMELQRMEEEARERMRQELEHRREMAIKRREFNLEQRSNLDQIRHGQGMTRPWIFSYFINWPRDSYMRPMGEDPDKKKKGFRPPRPKPKPAPAESGADATPPPSAEAAAVPAP